MTDNAPSAQELQDLLGQSGYEAWRRIIEFIHQHYVMDTQWADGKKAGVYEYKFRKSGKTLCSLYPRDKSFGFMVIFGKAEREIFEAERHQFSQEIQTAYEQTRTYHDGKWIMLDIKDDRYLPELERMLTIKKKPKKK